LTRVAAGTHVRLEHRGWTEANTAERDEFDGGWTSKLAEGLRSILASGA